MRTPAIVILALAGCTGQQPPPRVERMTGGDAWDAHVAHLAEELDGKGFTIVVERPFVVIGDGDPARVKRAATDVVRWAVVLLRADYFARDPDEILDVYLFQDAESYERNARELFGDTPETPYGYYSPAHKALIMNIATGGGTLVHEIVHPFVEANFPDVPAWFNEGLGSLYEQSAQRDGHIIGLPNWRLPALQKAIGEGKVPSFETLLGTSTAEFYDMPLGYNQARYLCYWLQEHDQLHQFYREFVAHHGEDPGGLATLKKVLGTGDLAKFQEEWEAWVMELQFP